MTKRLHPIWYVVMFIMAAVFIDAIRVALTKDDGGGLELLAQQVLNAVTLGGIYALIAVGYTLIYGIVKLINFAHGEIYMLGTFFGILLISEGVPFFPALLISMIGCATVSMTMDQIAYRPLRQQFRTGVLVPLILFLVLGVLWPAVMLVRGDIGFGFALAIGLPVCLIFVFAAEKFAFLPVTKESPRLAALITAIGMSLFLQNAAMLVFDAAQRPFPELDQDIQITIEVEAGVANQPGDPTAPEQLQTIRSELQTALQARVDERNDEVPFLYGHRAQKKSIEDARKMGLDDLPEREKSLARNLRAAAGLDGFEIREDEGRLILDIDFSRGTSDKASQTFRRDLKAWLKNPTRDQKKNVVKPGIGLAIGSQLQFSDFKAEHFFQKDLVKAAGGDRADGERRSLRLPVKTVFVWISALVILVGMNFLVNHTQFGAAMRACALDKEAASLMGVNVNRVILITFALSGAMAAVAGVLYGLYLGSGIYYRMGYYVGVMAFFAAVLGGIGNLKGAVLGGMILGFVEGISRAYVTDWVTVKINWIAALLGKPELEYTFNTGYAYAIACIILITVILIRPTGLLGSSEADRA